METFVLILYLKVASFNGNPAGVAMQEFNTYSSCIQAANKAKKQFKGVKTLCVKK